MCGLSSSGSGLDVMGPWLALEEAQYQAPGNLGAVHPMPHALQSLAGEDRCYYMANGS